MSDKTGIRYKLIDHTADIGIVAYGNDLVESFSNAAFGLFSLITDVSKIQETDSIDIEVNSSDMESLLVNWLNELIFIFETRHILFRKFDIQEMSEKSIKAICYGEQYNPRRHKLEREIKSTTYHMLEIDRNNNEVKVIFDI
jgi:SHS2 domain-containing protein